MAPFQKLNVLVFISLLAGTGSAQNMGINVANPLNPLHLIEPAGVVLDDEEAIMKIKYTKTNQDHVVGLEIDSKPYQGMGIGQKVKAGYIGVDVESDKYGAYLVVTSPYPGQCTGVYADVFGTNNDAFGGYFRASGNNTGWSYGVGGEAISNGNVNVGVFGRAFSGTTNWAGYFDYGNVYIDNKLGIGQLEPIFAVDVLDAQAVARFHSNNSVNGSVIELRNSTASPTLLGALNFGTTSTTPGQIAYLANNNMTFSVNGAERVRINSTGNMGIGQVDPTVSLDILDPQAVVRLKSNNTAYGAVMELRNSTASPIFLGAINFGTFTTTPGQIAYLPDNNMTFVVNNVERARINSTGLMGVGRTPTTNRLEVEGAASKSSAGDWVANSDARLKKNIEPLDGKEMLTKLLALQGVTYEWNDDKTGTSRPEGVQYGFTAQNIQDVFPTLVETDAAGYLQTPYGTYDAMMVEAMRHLHEENEMLKQELRAIKEMISTASASR